MTLWLGCGSLLLAFLLAFFSVEIAEATSLRERARIAADAAALAAIAESSPMGGGQHEELARRFAELNGAELVECLCDAGASAVQVKVTVEGVSAEARAVIDPAAVSVAAISFSRRGLHPQLQAAVEELLQAGRGRVRVVSGWRDPSTQRTLWDAALDRYGDPEVADDWVAPPGTSMHEKGLAVDLGGDLELAAGLVTELALPLHRPLPHEPWHFELRGLPSGMPD